MKEQSKFELEGLSLSLVNRKEIQEKDIVYLSENDDSSQDSDDNDDQEYTQDKNRKKVDKVEIEAEDAMK
ncbi:MAG: hypothetical protein EZS28_011507 [Streblomastix strix]|uniref:Uncharacterized protein n=1 Tax=Streblomastix strix TaxID=222440 RepID=A0A5J4WDC3_9EUKA|nr:MAG: hypothetical protein EZS28_011507 [Streblomastix strix]